MTDPTDDEANGPLAVSFPDPIYLQAPDGVTYCISDEGQLSAILGVETVAAFRATEKGLEWLTEKRHWENVEAGAARVAAIKRN